MHAFDCFGDLETSGVRPLPSVRSSLPLVVCRLADREGTVGPGPGSWIPNFTLLQHPRFIVSDAVTIFHISKCAYH